MKHIVHDQQNQVICFFDDILVFIKSESENKRHLEDTYMQLHIASVNLNREK